MNKLYLSLLFSFCMFTITFAQNADHVNRGGLGYVKFGLGFGSLSDLNGDLTTSFGESASISSTSFQIGAGGFMQFSKRILVGLEGYGLFHSTLKTGVKSARLTGGGGTIKLGYALLNNNKFLGFPHIGIGFGGNRIEIKNDDEEDFLFGETTVPQFFEERLRVRHPILDLGVSILKIPAPDTDGISIGLHLGFQTALGKDTWQMDNDDDVIGASDVGLSNFYIKLSIGGGGFFYKKPKPKAEEQP